MERTITPAGHYKLEILAVGGHGCQREKGDGTAVLGCNQPHCPDCIIREAIRRLQRSGSQLVRATLTHWPASEYGLGYLKENEVVDDLIGGIRTGSFSPTAQMGPPLEFKLSVEYLDGKGQEFDVFPTNRRTVRGVLEQVLGPWSGDAPDQSDKYPTAVGVFQFTNPGGSAYMLGSVLKDVVAGWSKDETRPWHIVQKTTSGSATWGSTGVSAPKA